MALDDDIINWAKGLVGKDVGPYVLDRYIGHGRVGVIFVARSRDELQSIRAVKLTFGRLPDGWQNELRKVQALWDIRGVVHLYDLGPAQISHAGRTELLQYTAWDYIPPGRNLGDYLAEVKDCPVGFYFSVIEAILRVLHACDQMGVPRHGDLHAGNILVGERKFLNVDDPLDGQESIYVADFGHGASVGTKKLPKDDYEGLTDIANLIVRHVQYERATSSDRKALHAAKELLSKIATEKTQTQRQSPAEIYRRLQEIKKSSASLITSHTQQTPPAPFNVGQLHSGEMFGDDWERWKRLFVPNVPAKSKVFAPGTTTILTGPRGCGKTTLFRRLSKRLMIECGPVEPADAHPDFIGLYLNANEIADAFGGGNKFRKGESSARRLIAYTNLCLVAELISVLEAAELYANRIENVAAYVEELLQDVATQRARFSGETKLSFVRALVEEAKWAFLAPSRLIHSLAEGRLGSHTWFEAFCRDAIRPSGLFAPEEPIFLLIDDYTTPRINVVMQAELNRIFFRRSEYYVTKITTEAATTIVTQDSTGKIFQIGDDYELIDMATESFVMENKERVSFLQDLFGKRLELDARIPNGGKSLVGLLGNQPLSMTKFARALRGTGTPPAYFGMEMFSALWSGDTRTMLQLVQEMVDAALPRQGGAPELPIPAPLQDRALTSKGGSWLHALTFYEPSDSRTASRPFLNKTISLERAKSGFSGFANNRYGAHLRAIVEAFQSHARALLLGKMIEDEGREVPRAAFRIEIIDEFRLDGMAHRIYEDLIRYGVFLRDDRGKSRRGALVPRLFLRRLLLPYCKLVPSTKQSITLKNAEFRVLLLNPDHYRKMHSEPRRERQIFDKQEKLI
jgi:energy-coupling factor transporter ATP-binding protein EcfA2